MHAFTSLLSDFHVGKHCYNLLACFVAYLLSGFLASMLACHPTFLVACTILPAWLLASYLLDFCLFVSCFPACTTSCILLSVFVSSSCVADCVVDIFFPYFQAFCGLLYCYLARLFQCILVVCYPVPCKLLTCCIILPGFLSCVISGNNSCRLLACFLAFSHARNIARCLLELLLSYLLVFLREGKNVRKENPPNSPEIVSLRIKFFFQTPGQPTGSRAFISYILSKSKQDSIHDRKRLYMVTFPSWIQCTAGKWWHYTAHFEVNWFKSI